MRHLPNGFGKGWKVGLRDARFFFGGVELNFDQDREPFVRFARGIVKLQRQSCVVDGVNPVKEARRATRFIALQMANQMPACLQIRQLRLLFLPLLHAIFAERAHARIVRGAYRFGGNRFRGGHHHNFFRPAIRASRRARDAFANLFDIRRDRCCARHDAF